ncbi:MAG TPA: transcriptional repressor, partial [Polyangiales bacterium]|nr:transcriptional repressor [Polyangiales bacterium]
MARAEREQPQPQKPGISGAGVPDDASIDELQGQLTAYMERKGLRSTSQRRLVSELFFRTSGHHSIDDVLAMARAQDPKVGYATVYRTMKLLVECGLANERHFGDTVTRFEIAL